MEWKESILELKASDANLIYQCTDVEKEEYIREVGAIIGIQCRQSNIKRIKSEDLAKNFISD